MINEHQEIIPTILEIPSNFYIFLLRNIILKNILI